MSVAGTFGSGLSATIRKGVRRAGPGVALAGDGVEFPRRARPCSRCKGRCADFLSLISAASRCSRRISPKTRSWWLRVCLRAARRLASRPFRLRTSRSRRRCRETRLRRRVARVCIPDSMGSGDGRNGGDFVGRFASHLIRHHSAVGHASDKDAFRVSRVLVFHFVDQRAEEGDVVHIIFLRVGAAVAGIPGVEISPTPPVPSG